MLENLFADSILYLFIFLDREEYHIIISIYHTIKYNFAIIIIIFYPIVRTSCVMAGRKVDEKFECWVTDPTPSFPDKMVPAISSFRSSNCSYLLLFYILYILYEVTAKYTRDHNLFKNNQQSLATELIVLVTTKLNGIIKYSMRENVEDNPVNYNIIDLKRFPIFGLNSTALAHDIIAPMYIHSNFVQKNKDKPHRIVRINPRIFPIRITTIRNLSKKVEPSIFIFEYCQQNPRLSSSDTKNIGFFDFTSHVPF